MLASFNTAEEMKESVLHAQNLRKLTSDWWQTPAFCLVSHILLSNEQKKKSSCFILYPTLLTPFPYLSKATKLLLSIYSIYILYIVYIVCKVYNKVILYCSLFKTFHSCTRNVDTVLLVSRTWIFLNLSYHALYCKRCFGIWTWANIGNKAFTFAKKNAKRKPSSRADWALAIYI